MVDCFSVSSVGELGHMETKTVPGGLFCFVLGAVGMSKFFGLVSPDFGV